MKYDAVIFDLFGTLVAYRPAEYYRNEQVKLAATLGIPIDDLRQAWRETRLDRDRGTYASLEGDIQNVCRLCGVESSPEQISKAAEMRLATYRLDPANGAIETLSDLKSMGVKLGLISDCGTEVPRIWEASPFAKYMDAAVFSCEVHYTKPDPKIYHLACERLGVTSERCLYVGDGGSRELTGATSVGMHPVLIRADSYTQQEIERPDIIGWQGDVITGLGEIVRFLK